jgi:hypothetical protein
LRSFAVNLAFCSRLSLVIPAGGASEIMTVRQCALVSGVYRLKVRRARYCTAATEFADGDWKILAATADAASLRSEAAFGLDGQNLAFQL